MRSPFIEAEPMSNIDTRRIKDAIERITPDSSDEALRNRSSFYPPILQFGRGCPRKVRIKNASNDQLNALTKKGQAS